MRVCSVGFLFTNFFIKTDSLAPLWAISSLGYDGFLKECYILSSREKTMLLSFEEGTQNVRVLGKNLRIFKTLDNGCFNDL